MSKSAVEEPFSLSLTSGIEKDRKRELGEGGIVKIFIPNCFVSQCRKKFVGGPFRESLISDIEKCYASEGYFTIFRRKYIVSQHRNTS